MDRSIKIISGITAVVIVACAVFFVVTSQPAASPGSGGVIYFFYGEECPHCHEVMPFIITLSKKYPEADIQILEIWHNQTNQQIYASVHEKLNRKGTGVPEVIVGDTILVGSSAIPQKLEPLIQEWLKK